MRISLFIFLLVLIYSKAIAEEFTIFEKDGRYGLRSATGEIAVPAVHDRLGWSNGSNEVFEGVIGFKRNNLWGLLSTKNKVLSDNKFYSLNPFDEEHLKASVKGRFSNQLFYGLLDSSGEIRVSFNYFDLQKNGAYLQATEFDQYQSKVGLLSFENEIIVPMAYQSIEVIENFIVATRNDFTKDVFINQKLRIEALDSLTVHDGLTIFRNGKVGFVNAIGDLVYNVAYKSMKVNGHFVEPIRFPIWELYKGSRLIYQKECDSLDLQQDRAITYYNGAQHIAYEIGEVDTLKRYHQVQVSENQVIVRHSQTGLWSVLSKEGEVLIGDRGRIDTLGENFLVRNGVRWDLYNNFGRKINRFPLDDIKSGVDNHFIARRNNYWGVLDFNGDNYLTFKYDAIRKASEEYYAVKFLEKWGMMDKHGNWLVSPEFDEIQSFGLLIQSRKGAGFSYFYNGRFLFRSTYQTVDVLGDFFVIEDEDGKKGLLDQQGSMFIEPEFDEIRRDHHLFVFKAGGVVTIRDIEGRKIVRINDEYEHFGAISEEFIPAKKNGRWGYLDLEGRLRIANRYENATSFSEGLAPIMLRGKWGFISKDEKLVIQPYYDEVSSFQDGLAIVRSDDRFGLIDVDGEEVVSVKWKAIERTVRGNYLVKNEADMVGLANETGSFTLRPDFSRLEDYEEVVIVEKNGLVGILDYQGNQLFKIQYNDAKVDEDHFLLRR